jgi:hypothetical protein
VSKEEEIVEFIDVKEENSEFIKFSVKDLIDGSILTRKSIVKQLPYVLFLSLLALIYIGNRYHAEKIIRDLDKLQNDVMDLRAESITSESDLMYISKQSEVARLLREEHSSIKESVTPPVKIRR